MQKFASCLLILSALCEIKGQAFDYEHQAKWYDQFEECSLNRQSPIELNSNEAELSFDMPAITFEYYNKTYPALTRIVNNGYTANIQLPKPQQYIREVWPIYDKLLPHISGAKLPPGRFVAESVHFHWGSRDAHGSEHVIDSRRYSLEMHILHRNSKYQRVELARENEDGLAVLALLYTAKDDMLHDFAGLDMVLKGLEAIADINHVSDIENFTLSTLFGDLDRSEFFTYEGSLTTPPCSQAVTWIVFSNVIAISHQQMQRFHKLADNHDEILENNYRSLQAKGNRKVYLRQKRQIMDAFVESPLFWELIEQLKPDLLGSQTTSTTEDVKRLLQTNNI